MMTGNGPNLSQPMNDGTPPRAVTIVEVGPRDGLQNQPELVSGDQKVAFIEALADAGLPVIETTSFVNPAAVPQLADADHVMRAISRRAGVRYMALVPNSRGLDRAVEAGVDSICLFTSATDAFCRANIRCSVEESFERFSPVVARAREQGYWIRGYVSVAFHCPYSGAVIPERAVVVGRKLLDLGCDQICFADTIGQATPVEVTALIRLALQSLPASEVALHFHDTQGRAIENVRAAWGEGIRIFDGSAGGLGGCPFAPGAPGNVATESLVEYFEGVQIATGIDSQAVRAAVDALCLQLPR